MLNTFDNGTFSSQNCYFLRQKTLFLLGIYKIFILTENFVIFCTLGFGLFYEVILETGSWPNMRLIPGWKSVSTLFGGYPQAPQEPTVPLPPHGIHLHVRSFRSFDELLPWSLVSTPHSSIARRALPWMKNPNYPFQGGSTSFSFIKIDFLIEGRLRPAEVRY